MRKKRIMNESHANLMLKFDGDNDFEVQSLSDALHIISNALYCIADLEKDNYLKVRVSAFAPGSFIIDFNLLCGLAGTLLTNGTIQNAGQLANTLIELFKLKNHLNGEPAKTITTADGQATVINAFDNAQVFQDLTITVYEQHPQLDEYCSGVANIAKHEDRPGITFQSKDNIVNFNSGELQKISKLISSDDHTNQMDQVIKCNLLLKQPDLIGSSMWGFYFSGHNIRAKIEDEDFLEKVHSRQIKALYNGVQLPVKLRISIDLDNNNIPIEKTERYTILNVTGPPIEPEDPVHDKQISML